MLKWNELSLRTQFLILFLIFQLFISGLIFYYISHTQTDFYLKQLQLTLKNESKLLCNNNKINFNSSENVDLWVKKMGDDINTRITLIRRDGKVIADSRHRPEEMDNHADRPEIREVLEGEQTGVANRKSDTLDQDMFYLALPILEEGKIIGVIRLSKSLNEINQVIRNNVKNYLIYIVVILIITFFLVWKFSYNFIHPITRMTEMAASIAGGNLQERISLKNYNNEIGLMARMFNYMADQLEHKIDEISEEKNRVEAIVSSMADGLIATDKNKQIILINPAAVEMLHVKQQDLHNKDLIEIVRHYRIDKFLQQVLKEKNTLTEEIEINNPEKIIIRCHFAPITNEQEQVIGGIVVLTDITELRKLEQIRKDFVANVSHELKTPLTSIIGYVDTLLNSEIDDEKISKKFLNIIKTEADRLSLLIRDLLNLSKLENEIPDLKLAALNRVIEKAKKVLSDSARKKDIDIKIDIEENLPLVQMIPEQIEQVIINLLDNGIKYSSAGGEVIVRAYTCSDKVMIEVEDKGIGIPEEDQDRIFERFYRVDKARSRALGGTGIGLSIVKHIVRGHQSEIKVASEPDKGTKFTFYLKQVK